MPIRKYTYYDYTISLCPECLRRIDAKIVFENDKVYMLKTCPEHGFHKVLIATDIEYYKNTRNYNKPSETPLKFNNKVHYGCPYDLEEVERMLDIIVASEGEPDVVQISGGEPTIHPDFFTILDIAKSKPIKHLMVNTNGVRIAQDAGFAERLATYMPDFELYLQFDSFRPEVLRAMRGKDLTDVAGRFEHEPDANRLTLTEVRQAILDQTDVFAPNDIIPVPCNPDALAMGYALKLGGGIFPLTRYIDPATLLDSSSKNTIVYEQDTHLHEHLINIFSTGISVDRVTEDVNQLLCCLPQVHAPGLSYENLFRIIIMRFIDAYDFDVRAIKKSCVHIVSKDGRIIPFETMNLFYRDEKAIQLANLISASRYQ
eukprot:gene34360-biopygen11528